MVVVMIIIFVIIIIIIHFKNKVGKVIGG